MGYNPNFRGKRGTATLRSESDLLNNTGATINSLNLVYVNVSGNIAVVDASDETKALNIIGISKVSILNGDTGTVVHSGRIEGITTLTGFGDTVYVSKTGELTNIKPSIGVNSFTIGDFVIKIGVIAKNELNPAEKDLIVNIEIEGQL